MAKITINPEDFFDFMINYMYDLMLNDEFAILNEAQKDLLGKFKKLGFKTLLMKAYLKMSSQNRLNFKRLKGSFYSENAGESIILIEPKKVVNEDAGPPMDFYYVKDVLKRCISMMKKVKYKNPNRIVTDEMLDKIITKVLKEE